MKQLLKSVNEISYRLKNYNLLFHNKKTLLTVHHDDLHLIECQQVQTRLLLDVYFLISNYPSKEEDSKRVKKLKEIVYFNQFKES